MKKIIAPVLLSVTIAGYACGQSIISSVNSGAYSGNNMSYTVGQIYVNPENSSDEANSGLMAVLTHIELYVGMNDEILSDDLRVLPNPTANTLFFRTNSGKPVEQVFIYDMSGKQVFSETITGNKADLSRLPNGVYFIKTDLNEEKSLKIIKQKP